MSNPDKQIAAELNVLVEKWKSLFDTKPDIRIFFDVDPNDLLTLNGTVLCPACDVDTNFFSFDVEELCLQTKTGTWFSISISWPYGVENPTISGITKVTRLFGGA